MYTFKDKPKDMEYRSELFKAKESIMLAKLDKSKKLINKLQESLATIKYNPSLKLRFEEKIAQESEVALSLIDELKRFRNRYSKGFIN